MAGQTRVARISKRTVDAASPTSERYVLWDSERKGFAVRISPQGVKSFIVRYRAGGGRRSAPRQFLIGRFGPMTADQAREQAKRILASVIKGEDPQAARLEQRAELTLSELCDVYLLEGCANKKASTLEIDRIRIKRHIKAILGTRQLSKIRREDIERLMLAIANGETRREANAAYPRRKGGSRPDNWSSRRDFRVCP